MINKNISIWRGSATPPTNYHLWEKEDGGLYVYLDEKWQHLVTPADKTILDKHQQQLDKIKNLALTEIDPIDTNTYKSYQLKSDDNIFGTTINIPKDRFIKQVTLGYDNATIDESTGIITIGTGLSKEYLLFSVALQSGSYELVSINLTNFLTEKDYSDGLEVVDNKLKVKVDPSSEQYLKVTNNGIKVEGINTKVSDTVEDIKTKIQNGEWLPVRKGSGKDSVIVGGDNLATKNYSYAEGNNTTASGIYSHAEGESNMALGIASHVEGMDNEASGQMSHAEGFQTKVSGENAHAQGCYNYNNVSFIDMVGVGNANTRKNASIICYYAHENPKNGYQYLLGVGGYKGQEIGNAKSVQEVFTYLETNKVDKVEGKQLSTNDYTTAEKNKVNESINESTANTLINTAISKLTKDSVGLNNVDNTTDANKEVLSATKLKTARTLWGQSFDGTANISGNITGIGSDTVARMNIEAVSASVDYIHMYLTEKHRPLVLQKGYGNVGIGVEAPVEKFEVDGNIKLTGSIKNVTEVYTTDGSKYVEPCTSDDIKALFA